MGIPTDRATIAVALAMALAAPVAGQCSLSGDLDGNGVVNGADIGLLLLQWGEECPAVIEAVAPASGPLAGGTAITITGHNLGAVQSVTIGGNPATSVMNVDGSTITAVTPPGRPKGPVDVVVTTTGQTVTLQAGFTYHGPVPWASVLEADPDPEVIPDPTWRDRIVATDLPWRIQDTASGIEMLLVPPGTFVMGCSPSSWGWCNDSEYPLHEVTITQPMYLGRYEVTQAEWTAIMNSNPSQFQSPDRPVDNLAPGTIQSFLTATGLRLPTEAEWEYVCRAGVQAAFNLPPQGSSVDSQLDQLAWYGQNLDFGQYYPVGQKLANNLGFHDMHGNVRELVSDWYGANYYAQSPPSDPPGPPNVGNMRILRGGCWFDNAFFCRASARLDASVASTSWQGCGFRVARTP